MKKVYFDNAATTPMHPEVIVSMVKSMQETCGNPSSTHAFGRAAKSLVETARKSIAKHLNVSSSEIIFTAGASEANNLILHNAVCNLNVKTIITSRIEHHAVLHSIEKLYKTYQIDVLIVDVDTKGFIDYKHLETLLHNASGKTLVSLMYANNEIGTLLDCDKVSALCEKFDALFHSDTVQGIGHYAIDLQKTPIDFIVASAHKFHGPKGVGFAYFKKGFGIEPLIFGGSQEKGARAGTENVHAIFGMAAALDLAYAHLEKDKQHVFGLKKYMIDQLQSTFESVKINGTFEGASYNILSVRFNEKSDLLPFQLDLKGIACSSGSACQSGSSAGSHVLQTILPLQEQEKPAIRFSFSHFNTKEEVDYVVSALKAIFK